jgi:xanthine dehydrogenase YagR molybdenum-binding subunit
VAIVVADTLEQAQHAATLVEVKYAETPSITTIAQGRKHAYQPERIFGGLMPAQTARGDADAGLAAADVLLDAEFRFAANHHNAAVPCPALARARWPAADRGVFFALALGTGSAATGFCPG